MAPRATRKMAISTQQPFHFSIILTSMDFKEKMVFVGLVSVLQKRVFKNYSYHYCLNLFLKVYQIKKFNEN